ncbi:hypothetical protein AOQ84DRAFT_377721 [Glonium stellatum]|uniref:Uncharacterized protein n=1 Tax=Glonium stellatum TaxID=574774 RepID=A0A8E2EZ83_9PEZI|nr:hypothetical protein AOQ84DRAFT_377721 [Glonium stellatum]
MSPSLETNLKVIEQNLDSMHQEAKHVLGKLIESSRKESELRQENEGLRQQTVGLQDRLEEAEKEKESIQEQLISLGDMKAENSNLTCRLQEAHVVIEDLKQQLQDERSKIDNIESMLTTRRKRPYSSGQDQNSDCHTEDHALAKRYRQDSGSGGKIHDKFDNPPSAPARQNLSDQARSDTPAHKNMNPPPRHGHDSSPANEPHKLRDGLSSHTIESNSAHQNSWPVAGNSGANRYQHGNWDSKYSFIPNILIPRPEASSEPELSIRGRAMAARGIQDDDTHIASTDPWFGLDALSDDSFLRTGRVPPGLSVTVLQSQTTSSAVTSPSFTPTPTTLSSNETNGSVKERPCSTAKLLLPEGMQSSFPPCSPESSTLHVTPSQSLNNRDSRGSTDGLPRLSVAKRSSVILSSGPLRVSTKSAEVKDEGLDASLLGRTSFTEAKTLGGGSRLHIRSSGAIHRTPKAQKITHDTRDETNLKRYFEDSPPGKPKMQEPKTPAQSSPVLSSEDSDKEAFSDVNMRIAKLKAELAEHDRQCDDKTGRTNNKCDGNLPFELDDEPTLEQTMANNTGFATTESHNQPFQRIASMVSSDRCMKQTDHRTAPFFNGSANEVGIGKTPAVESHFQTAEYPKTNQALEHVTQAAGMSASKLEQDLKASRKVADDLKRVVKTEISSLEQKGAEIERNPTRSLEEAQTTILRLMRECQELKAAVNEPLAKVKERNVELGKQLENMKTTTEKPEGKAKVDMPKLEERVLKQKQQYSELQCPVPKWPVNLTQLMTQMKENKQTTASQKRAITDLKRELENSNCQVAKLTKDFTACELEMKSASEFQSLKKQLEEAAKREKDVKLKLKEAEVRNRKSEQLLAENIATQTKQRAEAARQASMQRMQDVSNRLQAQLKDKDAKNEQLLNKLHESDENVVRLSDELSQLKENCKGLIVPKDSEGGAGLQSEAVSTGKMATLNRELQLLKEQLSSSEEKVAELMQQLSISEEKVAQLAQEMELGHGNDTDRGTSVEVPSWAEQKASADREIQELEAKLEKSEQNVARLTKDIAVIRSQNAQESQPTKQFAGKDKDLSRSVVLKERRIEELESKNTELDNKCAFLNEQLRLTKGAGSAQQQLTDLRKRIQEIDAKNHRLSQELKDTQERYLALAGIEEKVLGSASQFRGAAHLLTPPYTVKLPATVFKCIECYVKDLLCDSNAPCDNCKAGGHACQRWKCSLHKQLGYCPDLPCKLVHGKDGWLMTKDRVPQW